MCEALVPESTKLSTIKDVNVKWDRVINGRRRELGRINSIRDLGRGVIQGRRERSNSIRDLERGGIQGRRWSARWRFICIKTKGHVADWRLRICVYIKTKLIRHRRWGTCSKVRVFRGGKGRGRATTARRRSLGKGREGCIIRRRKFVNGIDGSGGTIADRHGDLGTCSGMLFRSGTKSWLGVQKTADSSQRERDILSRAAAVMKPKETFIGLGGVEQGESAVTTTAITFACTVKRHDSGRKSWCVETCNKFESIYVVTRGNLQIASTNRIVGSVVSHAESWHSHGGIKEMIMM
jgi:hypothetical protein